MKQSKPDVVNHPPHYKGANGFEVIDVIENFGLGFRLGNAVKYILRGGRKAAPGEIANKYAAEIEDLKKARWYIDREIRTCERGLAVCRDVDKMVERNNRRHSRRRSR